MTYYFIGGEDHDFTKVGSAPAVDTATTAQRRTANARCSLKVSSANPTDGWQLAFSAAQSQFWFTARVGWSENNNAAVNGSDMIAFLDGATRRLMVTAAAGGGRPNFWRLQKRTAASSNTTLATSTTNTPLPAAASSGIFKIDVFVNYGVSGRVQIYQDGSLVLDYSGDVTTDSATTLSGAVLGTQEQSTQTSIFWSEVVVASVDTRAMSVVTLPPAANGNTFSWSNSFSNINETTTDDTGLCSSASDDQVAEVTVTSSGITGNPGVLALCISARAQKGGTGPQNMDLVIRTGGTDYTTADQALPAAFGRVPFIYETNPSGSSPFLYSDLTAVGFNIGVKSRA